LTLTLTPALTLTLTRYNTFEQLCINFTNERLQSHFTDALIKRQQEDYKREGVTCAHINFPDNELQIQLIDGNKGSVSLKLAS
jgi:myosin heavy subunit